MRAHASTGLPLTEQPSAAEARDRGCIGSATGEWLRRRKQRGSRSAFSWVPRRRSAATSGGAGSAIRRASRSSRSRCTTASRCRC